MHRIRTRLLRNGQLLRLNFYGVTCDIAGEEQSLFHDLYSDFLHFVSRDVAARAEIEIVLHRKSRRHSGRRVCWPGGTTVFDNTQTTRRRAHIVVGPEGIDYVVNYIQSAVGEALEKRGWFRMHACGFTTCGRAEIWSAASGAGKSTRTLRTLTSSNREILGDEILLFKDGWVYPYPVPVATHELDDPSSRQRSFLDSRKYLISIPPHRIAQPTSDFTIHHVGGSRLLFIAQFVLGLGLPQMRVYLVRPNNLAFLIKLAFARLKFACGLKIHLAKRSDLREAHIARLA